MVGTVSARHSATTFSWYRLTLHGLLPMQSGSKPCRVRCDLGLLSAAARPRASAFGADAYPTFERKAAAFLHSIARNHALVDGDERLA